MPQALGGLGGIFDSLSTIPTWMKAVLGGLTGVGEIGNILAGRERSSIMNQLKSAQKAETSLTPEQLSTLVTRSTVPLSQGLTQAVGNLVQGEVGERGLAESPGIFSSVLSQALAPYYQQNQNTALQEVLYKLGLPIQFAEAELGALPQQTNMSPLLALLLGSLSKPGGGGGTFESMAPTSSAGFPAPTTTVGDTEGGDWFNSIFGNSFGLTPAVSG